MKAIYALLFAALVAFPGFVQAQRIPGLVPPDPTVGGPGYNSAGLPPVPGTPPLSFEQIRAECLIVRLPEARAAQLRPELLDAKRASAAQEKILGLLKTKEAELVDWPFVAIKSNAGAGKVENLRELQYTFGSSAPTSMAGKTPTPPPAAPVRGEKKTSVPSGEAGIGAVPNALETRLVGVTFEAEANFNPQSGNIAALMTATHTTFLGFRHAAGNPSELADAAPDFDTQASCSYFTMRDGQTRLLGYHILRQPEKTVELMLVTFTILPPSAPAK